MMWHIVVGEDNVCKAIQLVSEIIAFTIIAKKEKKIIVKSFVFCSASPAPHQHSHIHKETENPAACFNQSVFVCLSV